MNDITYTIIIPHHNAPNLLNRCLDSIPQREDIQIIVVDDNSKEELQPRVSRSDVEVIYIDAKHTKGAGRARNVGLERTKGKWSLFADCDDYYIENFIEVLDQYSDIDVDIVYFNYYMLDSNGMRIFDENIMQTFLDKGNLDKDEEDRVRYMNNAPWNKMVKTSFLKSQKILFEETPNGNDILYSLQLAMRSDNYVLNSSRLYNYIIQPNTISTKRRTATDILCAFEHDIKKSEFNKSIGHPEWKNDILKLMYGIIVNYGLCTFFLVMFRFLFHLINGEFNSKQWVKMSSIK